MRKRRLRRWWPVAVLVALPLAAPLLPWRGGKRRVQSALAAALGRRVTADAVRVVLLPWPGIELDNLHVAEDPAFGLEDMVVADRARATLGLRALAAGRLVFSSVHLDGAHINLVRNPEGRWNFAAFLDRAAPARPAAHARNAYPLPYIDWSDARINFKSGVVKERFYLDAVNGSLAREADAWRLQARFDPQRSDRDISDTGEIEIDGRWFTAGQGFTDTPFTLSVHIANAYLQAVSALLAGHDAGVHGILSADLALHGNARRIDWSGAFHAQSVRRWDLLPPPATIAGSFAGDYLPAADRLELTAAGDPGFRHLRLSGAVTGAWSHPDARLQLALADCPLAALLPLARALKAGLPDIAVTGSARGAAEVDWSAARGLSGSAALALTPVRLSAGGDTLTLAATRLDWNGRRVLWTPAAATLTTGGAAAPLALSAQLDREGFALRIGAGRFDAAQAAAFARLCAMRPFWPAGLAGTAAVELAVQAPWSDFRHPEWTGTATLADAVYTPAGGPHIALPALMLTYAGAETPTANFVVELGGDSVRGWLHPPAAEAAASGAGTAEFRLQADRLDADAVWPLLHASPDLLARWLGLGATAWYQRLRLAGSVNVADLSWRGYHTGLDADVTAAGGAWQATRMELRAAGGVLRGTGTLAAGQLQLSATVAGMDAAALLAATRYRGWLRGTLGGTVRLALPGAAGGLDAAGDFELRNGALLLPQSPPAADADLRFRQLGGDFVFRGDGVDFGKLQLTAAAPAYGMRRLSGRGSLQFGSGFELDLADESGAVLHLAGPLPAGR